MSIAAYISGVGAAMRSFIAPQNHYPPKRRSPVILSIAKKTV
ncbi:hypothetical protein [Roseofilum sp. Guam]|nr:hypothetical protein [Roseofilum sp. Guam]